MIPAWFGRAYGLLRWCVLRVDPPSGAVRSAVSGYGHTAPGSIRPARGLRVVSGLRMDGRSPVGCVDSWYTPLPSCSRRRHAVPDASESDERVGELGLRLRGRANALGLQYIYLRPGLGGIWE